MRIIDADELREFFAIHGNEYTGDEMICIAPTISPDSLVKRGRWIEHEWAEEHEGRLISNFECSLCHDWKREVSTYCPSCGALMED